MQPSLVWTSCCSSLGDPPIVLVVLQLLFFLVFKGTRLFLVSTFCCFSLKVTFLILLLFFNFFLKKVFKGIQLFLVWTSWCSSFSDPFDILVASLLLLFDWWPSKCFCCSTPTILQLVTSSCSYCSFFIFNSYCYYQ